MKRKDIEAELRRLGGETVREGRKHTVWRINGRNIAVPRHTEINEHTARSILQEALTAKEGPRP